jgi:hypothetical protein
MAKQLVQSAVVHWLDHLIDAGFLERDQIRTALTDKLEALCERDLVLAPAGGADGLQCLGIDKPQLFATLNIDRLRLLSKAALAQPRELARLLASMKHAGGPRALHALIVDGIKGELLAIREPPIDSPSEEFETDLVALARARGLAEELQIVEAPSDMEDVRQFRVTLADAITEEVQELRVIVYCSGRATSIYGVLPWNSPYLIGKLNRLLGRSWYLKTRSRFILPADCRQLVCTWGFYQVEQPELAKFECIKPFFEKPESVIANIRLDFTKVAQAEPAKMKAGITEYLEKQLLHSIGTLDARPDLRLLAPDLWWDLGLVRDFAKHEEPVPAGAG